MSYMKQVDFIVEEKKEKIIKHLKAKGLGPLEAEKEAARCLKEIEKNELKKAWVEYTENLDKLKNLWS